MPSEASCDSHLSHPRCDVVAADKNLPRRLAFAFFLNFNIRQGRRPEGATSKRGYVATVHDLLLRARVQTIITTAPRFKMGILFIYGGQAVASE